MLAKQLQGAAKSAVVDSDFENVTLLLHGNGTNGAQNNTFTDGSSNAFTITRNGNTTQGTFSPYGSNWSNYFDGTGDYLTVADNAALDFGTGDFTIEAWVYPTANNTFSGVLSKSTDAGTDGLTLNIDNGTLVLKLGTTSYTGSTVSLNTWSHVAATRNGTSVRVFLNGTQVASGTDSYNTDTNGNFRIGAARNPANADNLLTGYISNARAVKGTAVYTAAFTPPTAPLTAITNTSLLTCQSNRFIDNSTNAFTITRNGDVSVQRFSPFSPTAAYASGTIGGSGYFDGTGDYLSGPTNTATAFNLTGDFTIECWAYFNSVATSFAGLVSWSDSSGWNGWQFQNNAGTLTFEFLTGSAGAGTTTSSAGALTTGRWYHLAVVRSSSTITLYIDGVSRGTSTYSSSQTSSSSFIKVGADRLASALVTGYISNLRVVNGTAVYTAGFTPPTSPVTAITNTQLLLNYTNAGIIDNAMMNDLETVGNAQISTSVSKFGGGSMYFDGTGDYLVNRSATADLNAFGTGDFTIEFWLYFAVLPGSGDYAILFDCRPLSTQGIYPDIYFDGSTKTIRWFINSADRITGTTALSATTWYHVAVARSGTSTKMFLNGTQEGSTYTDSNSYLCPANRPIIAGFGFDPTTYSLNGYIDDLRITKGVARYTANFTAPTAPFADQ